MSWFLVVCVLRGFVTANAYRALFVVFRVSSYTDCIPSSLRSWVTFCPQECALVFMFVWGAMRRVDCHIFDGLAVKVVVLAVIPGGSDWERSLLKVVLSLLSCMESYRGLSAVSVGDNLRLGRALASVAHPSMPLVTRRFDSEWLTDLFRRKFIEESSGLEPFSILEYFRFRLSAVIKDSAFNNMPCLREVCLFCFCCFALFLSFCCGGGLL